MYLMQESQAWKPKIADFLTSLFHVLILSYFRSSLKITGLNPSGQHATATPVSSKYSGYQGLPPNLSVIIIANIASQAQVQNSFGLQQYSSTWNTCPSLKTGHGPLYFALIGGSLNTSLVSKRLSTVISK